MQPSGFALTVIGQPVTLGPVAVTLGGSGDTRPDGVSHRRVISFLAVALPSRTARRHRGGERKNPLKAILPMTQSARAKRGEMPGAVPNCRGRRKAAALLSASKPPQHNWHSRFASFPGVTSHRFTLS